MTIPAIILFSVFAILGRCLLGLLLIGVVFYWNESSTVENVLKLFFTVMTVLLLACILWFLAYEFFIAGALE